MKTLAPIEKNVYNNHMMQVTNEDSEGRQMIAIIDYDAGNIKSVEKALILLGEEPVITRDRETILKADKVILPGVGAFGDAMHNLRKYGLDKVIHEVVKRQIPLLGICLGLQLLFERSDETPGVEGLGVLKGEILRIPEQEGLKIPHMGWNEITVINESPLLKGLESGAQVYFVHSYYLETKADVVSCYTDYGTRIAVAAQKDNVFATQFHPEKSGSVGLKILKNFGGL